MKPPFRRRAGTKGFSLIELVVVIVLLGFLGAVGANLLADAMTTSYTVTNNQASGSAARYAAERIAREIRETPFAALGYNISTMNSTTYTFTRDDGVVVTIRFNSGAVTILYTGTAAAQTLVSGVSAFTLEYLDLLGGTVTNAEDVRVVRLTMTVTNAKTSKPDYFRTRIFLRNAQMA
jgi:prepilin-type N-terminal cleavage/methylation domain-containing protein